MMVVMTACQSEHKRQVGMLNELLEACERDDTMPNDSDARAVLYYMERHGSPSELQQAWRMIFVTPDAIERRRWPRDVFLVVGTG